MSFQKLEGFVSPELCESLVKQAQRMERLFYNEHTLRDHKVYPQDIRPGRKSSAYAVSEDYDGLLPTVNMRWLKRNYDGLSELSDLHRRVRGMLALPSSSRMLFNVQEYYSESEAVPKHFDGELLEFKRDGNKLDILKAVRPRHVAVLTLVNDVEGAGTCLHYEDGSSLVVPCKAGDLLIFDNHNTHHSVDSFIGGSKREDGLVRMIIGWRSLGARCDLFKKVDGKVFQSRITTRRANSLIEKFLDKEWPGIFREHQKGREAAF